MIYRSHTHRELLGVSFSYHKYTQMFDIGHGDTKAFRKKKQFCLNHSLYPVSHILCSFGNRGVWS